MFGRDPSMLLAILGVSNLMLKMYGNFEGIFPWKHIVHCFGFGNNIMTRVLVFGRYLFVAIIAALFFKIDYWIFSMILVLLCSEFLFGAVAKTMGSCPKVYSSWICGKMGKLDGFSVVWVGGDPNLAGWSDQGLELRFRACRVSGV